MNLAGGQRLILILMRLRESVARVCLGLVLSISLPFFSYAQANEVEADALLSQLIEEGRAETRGEAVDLLVEDFFAAALGREGHLFRLEFSEIGFTELSIDGANSSEELRDLQKQYPQDGVTRLRSLFERIGVLIVVRQDEEPSMRSIVLQPFKPSSLDRRITPLVSWDGVGGLDAWRYSYNTFCPIHFRKPREVPSYVRIRPDGLEYSYAKPDSGSFDYLSWNLYFCEARPKGGVIFNADGSYMQSRCAIALNVHARLLDSQLWECLVRSAGLLGVSRQFLQALVGERPPDRRDYFLKGEDRIQRQEYVKLFPDAPTAVDILYLKILYSDELRSGMSRAEAEPFVRQFLSQYLQ